MSTVVLVHGLWMNGWDMSLLGYRLRAGGFSTERFSYSSIHGSLSHNTQCLHDFLEHLEGKIHVVAHSFGGLVLRNLLLHHPEAVNGRIVTLGSPYGGSKTARNLNHSKSGRWILGKNAGVLVDGIPDPGPLKHEIGVIAGTRPLGMGMLLTRLEKPHDGTILLSETKLAGMTEYLVVDTNHMGLLFSSDVARQVMAFLENGCFQQVNNTT